MLALVLVVIIGIGSIYLLGDHNPVEEFTEEIIEDIVEDEIGDKLLSKPLQDRKRHNPKRINQK